MSADVAKRRRFHANLGLQHSKAPQMKVCGAFCTGNRAHTIVDNAIQLLPSTSFPLGPERAHAELHVLACVSKSEKLTE